MIPDPFSASNTDIDIGRRSSLWDTCRVGTSRPMTALVQFGHLDDPGRSKSRAQFRALQKIHLATMAVAQIWPRRWLSF